MAPLYLLIFALPLGVAGQNLVAALSGVLLLWLLWLRRTTIHTKIHRHLVLASGIAVAYVLWMMFASLMNPANKVVFHQDSYLWGYLLWAFLPLLAHLAYGKLGPTQMRRLGRWGAAVCLIFGVVALSQMVWGWQVQGTTFVSAPARARGFYSHPLTLAYVGTLVFPVAIGVALSLRRGFAPWAAGFGTTSLVIASQSRTVQALALAVVVFDVIFFAKGRLRVALMSFIVVGVTVVASTDNPISRRFIGTFVEGNQRNWFEEGRLTFWQVHWDMLVERPVLGHGTNLDETYRRPYYEAAGFGDFSRKYAAHNQYLQVAVSGGVVGLGLFLAWFGLQFGRAWKTMRFHSLGTWIVQALGVFAVGALMQNAFQDSEVRYALTLLCTLLWLLPVDSPVAAEEHFRQKTG